MGKMESRNFSTTQIPPKRSKKVMNLEQKVKILDLLMGGMTTAAVSRKYGVNESTIRCIRGQEEKIRLLASKFPTAKRAQFSKREVLLTKMEGLLVQWIVEESRNNGQPNSKLICEKALEFFHLVKMRATEEEIGDSAAFSASRGWYNNFRKRHLLDPTYMLSTTLGAEISPTLGAEIGPMLGANNIKEEAEDEDGEGIYSEHNHREECNVYVTPMAYEQTGMDESDANYCVNQSKEGYGDIIAPRDSEPSDNEVDLDPRCGQSSTCPGLTIKRLQGLMDMASSLKEFVLQFDPDPRRSSGASQKLESAMLPYKELLREMKERASQPRITEYFRPVTMRNISKSRATMVNSSVLGGN